MRYHAGDILKDPKYAITELTANAWDAGATEVHITWPEVGGEVVISDNGSGMTEGEFRSRWSVLNYNRLEIQGENVEFPINYKGNKNRLAFGRNGVGRHGMFCFADSYEIQTSKRGTCITASVRPSTDKPFEIEVTQSKASRKSGTTLRGKLRQSCAMGPLEIAQLLGSKFVSDPSFSIVINGTPVTFEQLQADKPIRLINTKWGPIEIFRFDSESGRTSDLSGIAWWVKDRLVGRRSWVINDNAVIDKRNNPAKRLNYVIKVDFLKDEVKADWSGFSASPRYLQVENLVEEAIKEDVHRFLMVTRRERKRGVIENNRELLKRLPPIARTQVAEAIEEIQKESPTISERDLSNVVRILSNLEMSNTGYELLEKLAKMSSEDLDDLDEILANWTVADAKIVLNELGRRMKLIEQLQNKFLAEHADELHELQPLFERGLWIFGPQYESISFTSNRQLATVVRGIFLNKGLKVDALTTPKRRPDFIVLPDASIGIYSADGFGETHEVDQIGHILIVELKRGGFTVGYTETSQAMDYAHQLRLAGVPESTPITAYVLGTSVGPAVQSEMKMGETRVIPMAYNVILNRAHQRTFNLHRKIYDLFPNSEDPDMLDIVGQSNLFDDQDPLQTSA